MRRGIPAAGTTAAARSWTRSRSSRSSARRSCSGPSMRTSSRTRARRRTWPATRRRWNPATHTTVAGPRAGFILCREQHAKALDSAVMPGMQGGPLMHTIAAKATCFRIAMTDAFRSYQRQIRANADALGESLQENGLDLVTGGTDTHLLLVDLRKSEWTGKDAEERLAEVNVTVNRNTVPFDERSPFVTSGVRVGTPAMTMRGFDEEDFRETGRIIAEALVESPDVEGLRGRVAALCAKRPLYPGWRGYTSFT